MSAADFPEWLLPDDPADATVAHYKAIAEWTFTHYIDDDDRRLVREMGVKYRAKLDPDVVGDLTLETVEVLWAGWELAFIHSSLFFPSDCDDAGFLHHWGQHFGRAMRFSAMTLLALTDDLPDA